MRVSIVAPTGPDTWLQRVSAGTTRRRMFVEVELIMEEDDQATQALTPAELLDDVSDVEMRPRLEGRAMTMMLNGTGPAKVEEEGTEEP